MMPTLKNWLRRKPAGPKSKKWLRRTSAKQARRLAAYRLLRPGGHVLLTTDNFDCLVASLARMLYRLSFGLLTYPVQRVFIEPNLGYFTSYTFRRLLGEVGFSEVQFERIEYPLSKIVLNPIERLILRTIYSLAAVTGRQAQMMVLARKPC